MDKMLISGGNGFLGSHLAERAIRSQFWQAAGKTVRERKF